MTEEGLSTCGFLMSGTGGNASSSNCSEGVRRELAGRSQTGKSGRGGSSIFVSVVGRLRLGGFGKGGKSVIGSTAKVGASDVSVLGMGEAST